MHEPDLRNKCPLLFASPTPRWSRPSATWKIGQHVRPQNLYARRLIHRTELRSAVLSTVFWLTSMSGGDTNYPSKEDIHGQEAGKGFPLVMQHPTDEAEQPGVWIRYCYHGGKLTRDGRLIRLILKSDEVLQGCVHASSVRKLLEQESVDLQRFSPHGTSCIEYLAFVQSFWHNPYDRLNRLTILAGD